MLKQTLLAASLCAISPVIHAANSLELEQIGRFETGVFDDGAAEVVAFDADSQLLFVINAKAKTVDVLDISDPTTPTLAGFIDVSVDLPDSGGVNSVAVHNGLVVVAVEHDNKQANGWAAFYDVDGRHLHHVRVGALPDMVTFTPDGQYVLVANEGEPSADYSVDPEGSISIIRIKNRLQRSRARTAHFRKFNKNPPAGVRISGPEATVAQDLEPEYIAVSHDSRTAWVTLQENNAMAIVDIRSARVSAVKSLGTKNHAWRNNGLDASNKDDAINIQNWPVRGTLMPDAIASYRSRFGLTYLVTANEGDGREYIYDGVSESECESAGHEYDGGDCISHLDEARVKDIELDPTAFPNATDLQAEENLGRLIILSTEGDTDGDGDYDRLYSFGGRSISIYNAWGYRVSDTGDIMEQVTAALLPDDFNSTNDENDSFDNRSDDKGPEPEGVIVGEVNGRQYAFVGLERVGGIMTFDVTYPRFPRFVDYFSNRDFSVEDVENEDAGDLAPEGILFICAEDSPIGEPLLVVGNEVSGTTTVLKIKD